jgi:predicted O-methyltransferase YrrM
MTTNLDKGMALLTRPRETGERFRNKLRTLFDGAAVRSTLLGIPASGMNEAVARLCGEAGDGFRDATGFPAALSTALSTGPSTALANLERRIQAGAREAGPFGSFHSASPTMGRLCYLLCRMLQPEVVVETGVAYGVTSSYILLALSENAKGTLHSIDLPPLARDAAKQVGRLVPDELRGRWELTIGSARSELARTIDRAGGLDIFVHDSLHTYRHMQWEMALALSRMQPGGALVADDIEGNRAFEEAAARSGVESWVAIQEEGKEAMCGALRVGHRL